MGIPYLFSHLTRKNPDLVTTKVYNETPSVVCLDFNCAIHFCNGELKNTFNWDIDFDESEYERNLIIQCVKYIDKIVDQFDTIDELLISIDGVPPQTKVVQQRRRRYLSSFMQSKLGITKGWDSNAISPGTRFMQRLNKRLTEYAHSKVKKVTFSSSEEPGEGETKIFNYLASLPENQFDGIYVYGLDADLIMLSLLLKRPDVFLMRESKFYHNNVIEPFIYLDIDKLSKEIRIYMNGMFGTTMVENYIESYVLLSMFIGNDFVPALSYLKIRSHSIEHLMKTLAGVVEFQGQRCEIIFREEDNWKINWNVMVPMLTALASIEDNEYRKMHNQYFSSERRCNSEEDKLNFYGVVNKPKFDTINPNKDGWRNRYYQSLFGGKRIEDICKNYVEGILWNVDYYFNKSASTSWFYKFEYAPTIFDVCNFATINPNLESLRPFPDVKYLTPNEHLISILPLQSHHMLSDDDRKITCDNQNIRFFPEKYRIQTYLKTFLHECYPIIPAMKLYVG